MAQELRIAGRAFRSSDLADREAGDRLVEKAWSLWTGLEAWFQIAGDVLTGPGANLAFDAKLDRLWAVDVVATMRLCRDVGQRMRRRAGSVITMGWDQAETGMEGDSGELFAATKGAIMAFTRAPRPGERAGTRVDKTDWGESASPSWQDRVLRETPMARWGTPEDVASVASFLIAPAAEFLTGQIVRINGGAVRLSDPEGILENQGTRVQPERIGAAPDPLRHRPPWRVRTAASGGGAGARAGFAAELAVLPISVAAADAPKWVGRHLEVPPDIDRVILPGHCRGDLTPVRGDPVLPVELGPEDLRDLPRHFGQAAERRDTGPMTSRSWPRSIMRPAS